MRAQGVRESPARVEFTVKFSHGPKGRRRARVASDDLAPRKAPGRVPKITRLLVLGYHFEHLVRQRVVKDYAEIARLTGLTRARVTQIVNLTLLAPEIQEEMLRAGDANLRTPLILERRLRLITREQLWDKQQLLLLCG